MQAVSFATVQDLIQSLYKLQVPYYWEELVCVVPAFGRVYMKFSLSTENEAKEICCFLVKLGWRCGRVSVSDVLVYGRCAYEQSDEWVGVDTGLPL